ncbi:protein of unknown function [Hyphomicrobium sp. MC1]|nr:protein of unknown function [Hyphomicrobium sp. MC1]
MQKITKRERKNHVPAGSLKRFQKGLPAQTRRWPEIERRAHARLGRIALLARRYYSETLILSASRFAGIGG